MDLCFGMHVDDVNAKIGEHLHIPARIADHQMHIKQFVGIGANHFDILGAECKITDEVSIHYIQMKNVRIRLINRDNSRFKILKIDAAKN